MTRPRHIKRTLLLAVTGAILLGAVASADAPVVHERKEVAGLAVVLLGEDHPAEVRVHSSFLKDVTPLPGREIRLVYRVAF